MTDIAEVIHIAVFGAPGSGKTRLISRIDEYFSRRLADCQLFRMVAVAYDKSLPIIERREKFQFGVVTLDLDSVTLGSADSLALEAQKLLPRIFIVGTKLDLVPQDYSEKDLLARGFKSYYAHFMRLSYFAVSSVTGAGIAEVCDFIVPGAAGQLYPSQVQPKIPSFRFLVTFPSFWVSAWILDIIASFFSLPAPENVNQLTPNPLVLYDSIVDSLVKSPVALAWDQTLRPYSSSPWVPTHKITDMLIAKKASLSEAANMAYVHEHTTIPVPQPPYPHLSSWLVMDLVHGQMLLECWEKQSSFMKFRIACTLRGYISQLRRLSGITPGTVVGGSVDGILFEDEERGPFDSSTSFRHWCEMVAHHGWCSIITHHRHVLPSQGPPPYPVMGSEWPLVFTHGDLNLGNIMLSEDGVLWIIDWASSGFFPPWLESVAIKIYSDAPSSWRWLRWFIAGTYPQYEYFWDLFIQDVHRFHSSW